MKKTNLDERQEMALLKIEHNGCWLAFWGLLAVLVIEFITYGNDTKTLGGEYVIFMLLSCYLSYDCIKHGIWDRKLKANTKTNCLLSILSGVIVGIIFFLYTWRNYPDKIEGSIASGIFMGVIIFFVIFFCLELSARSFRKKLAKMEEEPEEEEE